MDLLIRRAATNAAQYYFLYAHCVCSTENGTHVMLASDIIENNYQRQFVRFFVLVYVHPSHFGGGQFFHKAKGKCTRST